MGWMNFGCWLLFLFVVNNLNLDKNSIGYVQAQTPGDIKNWILQLKHRKKKSNTLNERKNNNLRGAIIPPNVDTKKLYDELSSIPARHSLPNVEKPPSSPAPPPPSSGQSLYLMFPSQVTLTTPEQEIIPQKENLPDDASFEFKRKKTQEKDRKAIVTFLCGGPETNHFRYARFLHAFAYTLRKSGYAGEILVLYTPQFPLSKVAKTLQKFDISTEKVNQMSIPQAGHRYQHMLTKLHIWNLLQYDQIMYYDVDFVFQKNPISAFEECGPKTPICAVLDQGIKDFKTVVPANSYFNAGFLIVIPSKITHQLLLQRKESANNYQFVEQDLLNEVFRGQWKVLDSKYNLMHSYRQKVIDPNIVAIHEKLPELRKVFKEKHYVWNDNFRRT